MKKILSMALAIIMIIGTVVGQETEKFLDMTLEELLAVEVAVATGQGKKLSFRESPAVITVISKDEIQAYGARNIYDILRMVPGFEFGADIEGINGVGMRGIFASEGKVLFLIDDIQMNDHLYGYPFFADMFFINQIEKIEILRGPGSAIYGGFAELAVVNIITTNPDTKIGARLNAAVSVMENSMGRNSAELYYGYKSEDLKISLSAGAKQGPFSDQTFTNYSGVSYDLSEYNKLSAWSANLGLTYKNFSLRVLANNLAYDFPFPDIEEKDKITTDFVGYHVDAGYKHEFSENASLRLRTVYNWMDSWANAGENTIDVGWYSRIITERITPSLVLNYEVNEGVSLVAGTEYISETGKIPTDAPADFLFSDGGTKLSYNTVTLFGQGLFDLSFANLTLGVRYDKHNVFAGALVPRAVLTRVMDKWHFKLLASKAYRAPTIANLDINPVIKPEFTTVYEFETGYQLDDQNHFVISLFDIHIKDVIVYYYDLETEEEHYMNYEKTGSTGLEFEYRHMGNWGNIRFNYSYYKANDTEVPFYQAYDESGTLQENSLMGFANHKLAGHFTYKFNNKISLTPSMVYLSKRYGYSSLEESYYRTFDPQFLLNASLVMKDLFTEGFDLALRGFDLLGTHYRFIQAYEHGYEWNWGQSREFVVNLQYNF